MSRDPRIDDYIAKAQPFAQEILSHVRDRLHAVVPDVQEDIKWRMPAYLIGGKLILITAAFKEHAALNFWRGQEIGDGSPKAEALGQFGRLKTRAELPPDRELDALILEAAELAKSAPAPRMKKNAPKPSPQMHPEFAAALEKTGAAKVNFDSFPPSAQRDYLEWVSEAKQDSTRQKRIATAVEWISEGKRRHWKYQ